MTAQNPNLIILSHPTYVGPSGATAAATYPFFTSDYKAAAEERAIDSDVVVNQNGHFKYVYDNGPGFKKWQPFQIACEEILRQRLGVDAQTQFNHLKEIWNYRGVFQMSAPDGIFNVIWGNDLEKNFQVFPKQIGALIEYRVTVQFEEATP